MSQKTLVQTTVPVPGGPSFGQVSSPDDLMNAQVFAHKHIEALMRDFLVGGCGQPVLAGFAYTLQGGMQIQINQPGQIVDALGKSYELLSEPALITIAPPDAVQPRIDLIVAQLAIDQPANMTFKPFVQLRTQAELTAGVAPYPPSQQNVATELDTVATIVLLQGQPSTPPQMPVVAPNQIPLWATQVVPGMTQLAATSISDERASLASLCVLQDQLQALAALVATGQPNPHKHPATDVNIGPGAGVWTGQTAQDFFAAYANIQQGGFRDPLTFPETLQGGFRADGRLLSNVAGAGAGTDTDGTPIIDIPAAPGRAVCFSDGVRPLTAAQIPATANPRLVNKDVSSGSDYQLNPVALSLAGLSVIQSSGIGDFAKKNAVLATGAAWAAAAARDGQFLEVYGGSSAVGGAGGALSNWSTYDTVADAITARVLTGTIPPAADRPSMFSCGDGVHILLATQGSNGMAARWFFVNTTTWVSTEIMGGPNGAGNGFLGDLIQTNLVLIVVPGNPATWWTFNVATQTFTQLLITGSANVQIEYADACVYQQGQLVLFTNHVTTDNSGTGATTYVFNYATLTLSQLPISQPSNLNGLAYQPITYFRMRNIGGRATLFAGYDGNPTGAWVLTPGTNPTWSSFSTSLPSRWQPAAASLIVGGLPIGNSYLFGGGLPAVFTDIYSFVAGGVINTVLNGVPGITLAPGTIQAVIQLTNFNCAFQVATLLATLIGSIPPGSVSLKYSLDGAVNWQSITPNVATAIAHASNPSVRVIQITMISTGAQAPVLTGLTEHFEKPGGPTLSQLFIRFNPPTGTNGLFMNRDGSMFFGPLTQSTIDCAVLLSIVNTLGSGHAPVVVDYRNMRFIQMKFTGAKSGGGDPTFQFDFGRNAVYHNSFGVTGGPTGAAYKISLGGTPTFNQVLTVPGLVANGDNYYVEVTA